MKWGHLEPLEIFGNSNSRVLPSTLTIPFSNNLKLMPLRPDPMIWIDHSLIFSRDKLDEIIRDCFGDHSIAMSLAGYNFLGTVQNLPGTQAGFWGIWRLKKTTSPPISQAKKSSYPHFVNLNLHPVEILHWNKRWPRRVNPQNNRWPRPTEGPK